MNKQILIIYEYDILYDILFELKNFLSFKIQKVSKKDLKTSIADQNNLVVSKKDLNLDNQFKINHIPIELNKLIDQLNVGFLQKKIALQKNIKVGNYYINFNSRKISNGDKSISVTEKENPFFLYVSFMAPHDPRNPPQKYREIYYKKRPPLPKNFLPQHPFQNAPPTTSGRDEGLAPWPRSKEMISDQLCEYYGLVTHLDKQVGRILKALEQSEHADNTIVIYTADHGLAMGSHGLLGKQNVYEQSMQCPLILKGPGIPKGKSSEAFTYVHDLYATLCNLAGVTPENKIDSKENQYWKESQESPIEQEQKKKLEKI